MRKRSSSPDLPVWACLPLPNLGIPLQSSSTAQCLTCSVIMSAERRGVLEWQRAVMRLKCFLSAREKGFAGGGEGRNMGAWWGLAADFISLSEMIFPSVLRMEEHRELKKGRKLPWWHHQATEDRTQWEADLLQPRFPLTISSEAIDFPGDFLWAYTCQWPRSTSQKVVKESSTSDYSKHLEASSLHHSSATILVQVYMSSDCTLMSQLGTWHYTPKNSVCSPYLAFSMSSISLPCVQYFNLGGEGYTSYTSSEKVSIWAYAHSPLWLPTHPFGWMSRQPSLSKSFFG